MEGDMDSYTLNTVNYNYKTLSHESRWLQRV